MPYEMTEKNLSKATFLIEPFEQKKIISIDPKHMRSSRRRENFRPNNMAPESLGFLTVSISPRMKEKRLSKRNDVRFVHWTLNKLKLTFVSRATLSHFT